MLELSALKEKLNEILNDYDNRLNPKVGKDEWTITHYAKRLLPCNPQKFFCGARGRVRLESFKDKVRTDTSANSPDFLLNLFDLAFDERNKANNSWLAKQILFFISGQVKLTRMLYQAPHTGSTLEPEGIYFSRVRTALVSARRPTIVNQKN